MATTSSKIFSRERLAGYDPETLARCVALVIGAGALGQNTVLNLALTGIGEIRLIDKDVFEEHNRTRSPAYPLPDEQQAYGLGKARAVACKLRRLMTSPRPLMRYAHAWIQELGDGAFKGASVVVSCVDTPLARAYASDKARQHGLPFVEGGFEAGNVTLTSFPAAPGEKAQAAPCWRCAHQDLRGTFSCRYYAARAESAGIIPAIQNAAAVLAGLQAEAAVLALHPPSEVPKVARAIDMNVRTGRSRVVKLAADPLCPGLHRADDATAAVKLTTSAEDTVWSLLQELGERIGGPPRLKLQIKTFSKLIWKAPCTAAGCENMADVRAPEWAWLLDPRCSQCGGLFRAFERGHRSRTPVSYSEITLESNPEVLRSSCRQIGLRPLSLVEAESGTVGRSLFELAGSLEDLFETGDAS